MLWQIRYAYLSGPQEKVCKPPRRRKPPRNRIPLVLQKTADNGHSLQSPRVSHPMGGLRVRAISQTANRVKIRLTGERGLSEAP